MRLLLVDTAQPLRDELLPALSHHDVDVLPGDPRDRDRCEAAADCDVVIQGMHEDPDPLERLDRATRGTWNLLTTTNARRYIQLSSMRTFEAYAPGWAVDESWQPRPTVEPGDLAAYLAEITCREITRARAVESLILRLDEVVPADVFEVGPPQPRWLHLADAVAAVVRAVECPPLSTTSRWHPLHITRGGPGTRFPAGRIAAAEPFAFVARHQSDASVPVTVEPPTLPDRPAALAGLPQPHRLTLFGAGGPLAAAAAAQLRADHQLLLTDVRPLAHFATAPPQSTGAPRPTPASPPHDERIVDITDAAAVHDAARDADGLINCTVVRTDPVAAFRVNVLGAYNVMRAAASAGISRVVHTGPALHLLPHPLGYAADRAVPANAPPRPGDHLYFVTKYLALQICRIFAEHHGIACPTLHFHQLIDPTTPRSNPSPPFTISWNDAGRAVAAAARVTDLPEPAPVIDVRVESPHDHYTGSTTRALLDWEPQDHLTHLWTRTT